MAPLTVALALGIGDTMWACQKLRGLKELEGRPLYAYVNSSDNHASVGFLELIPFIDKAFVSRAAPYDVWKEMPPNHRDPKWSVRENCRGWNDFDYVVVANGHLEMGGRIETFFEDCATEHEFELNIPKVARASVRKRFGKNRVLLYLSGLGPNQGFHMNSWSPRHWARTIQLMNREGITPLLVGAPTKDDYAYEKLVRARLDSSGYKYDSAVGQTTIPEYCALIEDASVWVGLNSGGGIVSGMRRTPTVMMWSDDRYPKVAEPGNWTVPLHRNLKTSWLSPEQLKTYRTLSYGSPDITPERVLALTQEVMR